MIRAISTPLASILFLLSLAFLPSSSRAIDNPLEDALLQGNWEKLIEVLEKDNTKVNDLVFRLIMGHACLATNRNNESSRLFRTAISKYSLNAWKDWTQKFLKKHPENAIALYLRGDASSRRGKHKQAIFSFSKAIKIKPNFELAWNGRGVARGYSGDWEGAFVDFTQAPGLASAWANMGVYGVIREVSIDFESKSLEATNKALEINPNFALAYNTRGCLLFGAGRVEDAAEDFIKAYTIYPELHMAQLNESHSYALASKVMALLEVGPSHKSMSLQTRIERHNAYKAILDQRRNDILERIHKKKSCQDFRKSSILSSSNRSTLPGQYRSNALQLRLAQNLNDIEMKMADIQLDIEQIDKGIEFVDKGKAALSFADSLVDFPRRIKDISTIKNWDDVMDYGKGKAKEYIFTLAQNSLVDRIGLSEALKQLSKAAISRGAYDSVTLLPRLIFSNETLNSLKDQRMARQIERQKLAVNYQRNMYLLRKAGIEMYRNRKSIAIQNATGSYKREIQSSMGQLPKIRHEFHTKLDRPFWDLGALVSHLRAMRQSALEDYSRFETNDTSMRIISKPWNEAIVVFSNSPASQNIMASESVKRGLAVAIPRTLTNNEIKEIENTKPFAIVDVSRGEMPSDLQIPSPKYRNEPSRYQDTYKTKPSLERGENLVLHTQAGMSFSRFKGRMLIDVPGVNWKGGARENDWGSILNKNKTTIYVRHPGSGKFDWDAPKEKNAIIVTLPSKWNRDAAEVQLSPHIQNSIVQKRDFHVVVDINVRMERHLSLPVEQSENRWAGKVADFVSEHKPSHYRNIFASHSRGTVTCEYADMSKYDYAIISSPRGDKALRWIDRTEKMPETKIVTGLTDAPSWRWKTTIGKGLGHYSNNSKVEILQFQEMDNPIATHSKLQNLETAGKWKIISDGNVKEKYNGTLGNLLGNTLGSVSMSSQLSSRRWGFKGAGKGQFDRYRRYQLENTDDISRRLMPPFFGSPPPPPPPPPGEVISHSFRAIKPSLKKKWKQFSPPTYTHRPGGVSTKELAKTFVDRGNWPVLTSFGFFYKTAPTDIFQQIGDKE